MKKALITLFFLASLASASLAQELRINTYAGYAFKDKVDSYYSNTSYYDGTVQDGFRWGAGVEYHIPYKGAVELQYLRQDTNAPTVYQDGGILGGRLQSTDFQLGINWIFLNGTRYFDVNEIVEPFAGAGIGMGIFALENPDSGRKSTATKFAWNIRGGANFWIADNVAIRIQASLMSAVQSIGGSFYFGTGGSGAGVGTYSSIYQFGFDGGLVVRIPQ